MKDTKIFVFDPVKIPKGSKITKAVFQIGKKSFEILDTEDIKEIESGNRLNILLDNNEQLELVKGKLIEVLERKL